MTAIQKSQTIGPAILPLLGERAGVRASYPLPTWSALINHPNGVQSFSPGLSREAAATLGGTSQNPTADSEAARSAKFICGNPIRPIRRIRPIPPHPKSTLIKVENGLSPTCHRPKIRPENKGIKPNTNRHRPKNCPSLPLIQGKMPAMRFGGSLMLGCWSLEFCHLPSSILYPHFVPCANLRKPVQTYATPPPPRPFTQSPTIRKDRSRLVAPSLG